MSGCKVWLAFEENLSGEVYRQALNGYPCEIQGVTMIVYKALDKRNKPKWRVADPYTGYKATDDLTGSRKEVINKIRKFVIDLERQEGKPFTQIMDEKRKKHGNVMSLPERGPDGIQKPMST